MNCCLTKTKTETDCIGRLKKGTHVFCSGEAGGGIGATGEDLTWLGTCGGSEIVWQIYGHEKPGRRLDGKKTKRKPMNANTG